MNFNIITFGCKVNTYESTYMQETLTNNGFKYNDDYKNSDIVIINTCSVTNQADIKCKKMIRSVRRENPSCILMVCGCTAENKQEELLDLGIDILIGNKDKSDVLNLINNFINNHSQYTKFYNTKRLPFENMFVKSFSNQTRAYVKIQDGCNNYCAYCIIPYMRGNIRSKEINEAIEEINNLVNMGHKEIVFTGINTGAYGKETGRFDLVDLIKEISKNPLLERIRVSSIEITEINDRFIKEMHDNPKLCGHLHVSLQSGSDTVLKRMNRKYTKKEYLDKIKKLKEARPNINLTTDVIVGFPGETEDEFAECIEFCKEVEFSKIHVFPYSKREGTAAAKMPEQLDNAIKKERARKLIKIDEDLQLNYNNRFKNQEVTVLIEEIKDGKSIGHTENFLKVEVPEILKPNQNYQVIITETEYDKVQAILK